MTQLHTVLCRTMFVAMVAVGSAACGVPTDEDVKAAFVRENPAYSITAVYSGEGDSDTVYKHIRYRRPGGDAECEVVWGYQRARREWRVFHMGDPWLAGTVCEGCTKKPCK